MSVFQILIHDLYWIDGAKDDPKDLCLHDHLSVKIGDKVFDEHGTISATALYLLKTLTVDKIMQQHDIQMLPCCGHFLIANDDLSEVSISGCNKGTDWSTIHVNNDIKIILTDGTSVFVPFNEYRNEVFNFVDQVEAFYNSCTPKELPKDDFVRNGYIAFWNEWKRRRKQ